MTLAAGSIPYDVAYSATLVKGVVAYRATDVAPGRRYLDLMLSGWINEALDHSGLSQAEVARRLSAALQRSIDRAAVNKMVKGTRTISADELMEISKITDYAIPSPDLEQQRTVPLIGFVGAGALHVLFDGPGELDRLPAPDGASDKTVAVEIRGDSLGTIFDHWIVFYDQVLNPPSAEMLGKLCVVGLADGQVLVKQMGKGQIPGHFHLYSSTQPPIYDAVVEWAARVRQMSPRE